MVTSSGNRFAPSLLAGRGRAPARPRAPEWGLGALLIFAFGSLVSPPLLTLGTLMALIVLVATQRAALRSWISSPLVGLSLLLCTWVIVRALASLYGGSLYGAAIRYEDVWAYARIAGPLAAIFGLFLALNARYRYWVLAAYVLSWLIWIGEGFTVAKFVNALEGSRLRLGDSPMEVGMFGGGAFMAGLGCVASSLSRACCIPRARVGLLAVGMAGLITGGLGLFLSQTRSAWLGFAFVLPIVLAGWAITQTRSGRLPRSFLGWATACLLVISIAVGWASKDIVVERFARDQATINAILAGKDEVPFRSWGKRYIMYTEGAQMIAERPLTGFGPGTIRNIREHYDSERLYGSGHFHSFSITAGVALGIGWTLLWLGLAGALLWRGTKGFIKTLDDPHFAWSAAGFLGFYLATTQFQVRMFQSPGSAYLVLAMALLFGGALLAHFRPMQDHGTHAP